MRRDVVLIPIYLWVSASICLHILSYVGTDEVAALYRRAHPAPATDSADQGAPPAEIDFQYTAPPPPASVRHNHTAQPNLEDIQAALEAQQRLADQVAHRDPRQARVATAPHTETPPPAAAHPVTPLPAQPHLQVVDTHDSNLAAPTDPAFLSQQNNDVREQTQAAVRNLNTDASHPQLGGTPHRDPSAQQGNGAHDVTADQRDVEGDHNRVPDTARRAADHDHTSRQTAQTTATNTAGTASTANTQEAAARAGAVGAAGRAGTPGESVAEAHEGSDPNVITAYEGNASISIASTEHSSATTGQGGQNGHDGHNGQRGQSNDAAGRVGVDGLGPGGTEVALTPSPRTYESVYGTEAIHERVEAQQRRSQMRGNYEDSWRENRAAIENYIPAVRVGNQTALRTAQSPFAGYITAMHRRIHRLFADGFLADLSSAPSNSPLNDMSLVSLLEIVLEHDGRIHRLGVVHTSGNLAFDVAALNSVRHAAPFGNAPSAILSGDSRVYVHWAFHRNGYQCTPAYAEPYIIPNPGGPPPAHPTGPTGPVPSDEHPPMPPPGDVGSRDVAPRVFVATARP